MSHTRIAGGRDDAAAIEAMKRKATSNVAECFAPIENTLLKSPWAMGTQYTICARICSRSLPGSKGDRHDRTAVRYGAPQTNVGALYSPKGRGGRRHADFLSRGVPAAVISNGANPPNDLGRRKELGIL
jgi:hypothetical protein